MESIKIRTVIATIVYTESKRREEKMVTIWDDQPNYTLAKLFIVEFQRKLIVDKSTNEILIPE